ncbi:thiamine diphosphokinase [Bacillus sp. FJAT-49736]|uniref:thiamine diphosphokinase n=1 Tax=Bacillus sp. FJAT-49736 TaxID=2833582 RepID=UPI001BC997CE|nr:thiamine diphosphokinase [Bacillus sp. FJAT-49736]MBS4172472.1 thiamine diphosphokinase [Bacillus sp. FJAT-49736]
MNKIVCIVAGGPSVYIPNLQEFKDPCIWVGVDYGVFYLLENGINPDFAFGDFDSVSDSERSIIRNKVKNVMEYNPEKDETDLELALQWALQTTPTKILIFGATGGRADHYFANAFLLIREEFLQSDCEIEIVDCQNKISTYTPGTYKIHQLNSFKYVSFLPLSTEVTNINLTGFKYPLSNKCIKQGTTLCISNELLEEIGTFSFSSGILMMIRSKDV